MKHTVEMVQMPSMNSDSVLWVIGESTGRSNLGAAGASIPTGAFALLTDIPDAAAMLAALKAGVPSSDPHVAGELWNSSGTLMVSAG